MCTCTMLVCVRVCTVGNYSEHQHGSASKPTKPIHADARCRCWQRPQPWLTIRSTAPYLLRGHDAGPIVCQVVSYRAQGSQGQLENAVQVAAQDWWLHGGGGEQDLPAAVDTGVDRSYYQISEIYYSRQVKPSSKLSYRGLLHCRGVVVELHTYPGCL